ncbi:MAG: FHA domain-containing protein, partial [Planctomycetota bacterium]|nr:FHA domain-containing protein [Planctomycetota bacterium]
MVQLQVLSGKRQGFVLDIEGDEVVDVGNRKTARLSIRDPWISWNHARIMREGERFFLEDAGSSNGTWVNGEKVKRRELRANDVIYFG